jgi:hypothetical protein
LDCKSGNGILIDEGLRSASQDFDFTLGIGSSRGPQRSELKVGGRNVGQVNDE